jgi:hypothetical protein
MDPAIQKSGMALSALRVARIVDLKGTCENCGEVCEHSRIDPRDLAALIRELRVTMIELMKLSPPAPAKDDIDDLAARREKRRSS